MIRWLLNILCFRVLSKRKNKMFAPQVFFQAWEDRKFIHYSQSASQGAFFVWGIENDSPEFPENFLRGHLRWSVFLVNLQTFHFQLCWEKIPPLVALLGIIWYFPRFPEHLRMNGTNTHTNDWFLKSVLHGVSLWWKLWFGLSCCIWVT